MAAGVWVLVYAARTDRRMQVDHYHLPTLT